MATDPLEKHDLDALMWSREVAKCRGDFKYFASTYLRILSRQHIQSTTLALNPVQEYLWKNMMAQKRKDGWIRQIWGKPRKIGATTFVRGLSFWLTAFQKYRKSLVVTHDEPSSHSVFAEQDLNFYSSLPIPLRPQVNLMGKAKLNFQKAGSTSICGHARNQNVGVTQVYDIMHMTEAARYRDAELVIKSSLFPSLSRAKAYNDDDWGCSICVIESTSRYGGTVFKDFAEAARRGENEYQFIFIPAYLHDDYQMPVPANFKLTTTERALMEQHKPNLPIEHIVWRRREMATYKQDPALFRQEYPLTWEESWILPSGTTRVFSDDDLEIACHALRPGKRMMPDEKGLHPMIGGPFEVWAMPVDGQYYDIGIDVASGRGSDGDRTAIEVIRRDTLEQAAECITIMDPASPEFADLIYWIGMVYNTAQLVPDVTGGWGWALLSMLQRRSYPNIWRWRRRDDANERVSTRLGFLYTHRYKMELVNNAAQIIMQRHPKIYSAELYEELIGFLEIGVEEWGPAPGMCDDVTNAYMLALMGSYDEESSIPQQMVDEPKQQWVPPEKDFDFDYELTKGEQNDYFGKRRVWG